MSLIVSSPIPLLQPAPSWLGRARPPSPVAASLVALAAAASGCGGGSLPALNRDLGVSAPVDLSPPDRGVPDLPGPDLVIRDLAPGADLGPTDLAAGDGPPCQGGYLNSDAPNACPLSCSPAVRPVVDEGATHIPFCTPIPHVANPPASGNHWPWPGPWGISRDVIPREWWIHNLEHQGVVLLYNCPYPKDDGGARTARVVGVDSCVGDGGALYPMEAPRVDDCAAEIAQLEALYAKQPPDNFYDALFEVRMVVTQDPLLPKRFAAVAWDWVWMDDQLDVPAIECFIASRYGRGPEAAP